MERYIIKEKAESGTYERGDNYLSYISIRDGVTREASTPSSVQISIFAPNGNQILAPTNMTSEGGGEYSYDYTIDSSATYGEYTVNISTATYNMSKRFHYFIFPWDANSNVREITGVGQNKSISDEALNRLIWQAFTQIRLIVFDYHYYEAPDYCACNGEFCIDGSNTTFFLKSAPIADFDGDGSVGTNAEELLVYWVDSQINDCILHKDAILTMVDAEQAKLLITQADGNPIPSDACGIYVTYYSESEYFDESRFREAVEYLAAHKMILRFGELERATSADLVNAQNVKYIDPNRFWEHYQKIIRVIAKPNIGGAIFNP